MIKSLIKTGLLTIAVCLPISGLFAQKVKNFDYNFKIKGLSAGDTCMIAYYLGSKQYIKDTLLADKNGSVSFRGDELDGGIFLFVIPGMKYFEFLAVDPKIYMETEKNDLVPKMQVKYSPENSIFFQYLKFIEGKTKEAEPLKTQMENESDPAKKEELRKKLQAIDDDVKAIRSKTINDNKGKFVSKLLAASLEPEVAAAPEGMSDTEAKNYQFRKYKSEYLDFVDFSDERMLRTPILQSKIKEYLGRLTVQHPDSIILSIEDIMARATANPEVFKFCVITITNMWAGTKQMCFDKIYTHMAGTYYVSGRATWIDSTQLAKITDRYYKMLYNSCDRVAVNLILDDINGKPQNLHALKANYTILVFWAYDCGHCKKEMPQLYELYNEFKPHGVEVYAVCTKEEVQKWKDFVKEKEIGGWINVSDLENKSNFRVFYDVYSTPVIYLLDKDKKIMAKRLDIYNLKKYLCHELGLPEPPDPGPSHNEDGEDGH